MPAKAASKPAVASITDLLAGAAKKYDLQVGSMDDIARDIVRVSSGNLAIDYVIGGGVPLGRTIEAFGLPGSGKSSFALQTAANVQQIIHAGGDKKLGIGPDDAILYLDYEHAMDKEYAAKLGFDVEDSETVVFVQPDTLEDGANFAKAAIQTGRFRLVIVDAVAAMNPQARTEAEIGQSLPALTARLMGDFTRDLNAMLDNHNCSVIFLNHLMNEMGIGKPGVSAKTTPGGRALKYYASVRIEFTKTLGIKGKVDNPVTGETEEQVVGHNVIVTVVKNKTAPPLRKANVRVRHGVGFDAFYTAMQILMGKRNKQVVRESGGMHYFHRVADKGLAPEWMDRAKTGENRPYIRGDEALIEASEAHPEWRDGLLTLAAEILVLNEREMAEEKKAEREAKREAVEA